MCQRVRCAWAGLQATVDGGPVVASLAGHAVVAGCYSQRRLGMYVVPGIGCCVRPLEAHRARPAVALPERASKGDNSSRRPCPSGPPPDGRGAHPFEAPSRTNDGRAGPAKEQAQALLLDRRVEALAEKFRAALTRREVTIRDSYDLDHAVSICELSTTAADRSVSSSAQRRPLPSFTAAISRRRSWTLQDEAFENTAGVGAQSLLALLFPVSQEPTIGHSRHLGADGVQNSLPSWTKLT